MTVPVQVAAAQAAGATVRLTSDEIEVVVLPGKGADVLSFVDRATGVDVLAKSPWAWSDPASLPTDVPTEPLDEAGWLARYAGGWQLLLPNAGAARDVGGVRCGYHGEASVVPWTVLERTDTRLVVTVRLTSTPLHVTRTFAVHGPTLDVRTEVENLGADAVPVTWVEHPAFGRAFVDEHSVLETGARSVLSDADDPGAVLAPDVLSSPASAVTRDGGHVDLHRLPGPASGRKVFAALTDFDDPYYAIHSPTVGFGIRVDWDAGVLPHAWFWQECHATQGFPWFGEAFAVAVEPANVVPGSPGSTDPVRAAAPLLAGFDTWSTTIRMSRTDR